MDFDLAKNKPVAFDSKTQYLGLGAGLNAGRYAQVRMEYWFNLADNATGIASMGVGVLPFVVYLDVSVVGNASESRVAVQIGFRCWARGPLLRSFSSNSDGSTLRFALPSNDRKTCLALPPCSLPFFTGPVFPRRAGRACQRACAGSIPGIAAACPGLRAATVESAGFSALIAGK